jgi:hypothetical protein
MYNSNLNFGVYLGEEFSQKLEWYEKNIISLLKLPFLFAENINLLPPGVVDILYCTKMLSSIDFLTENNETFYVKQLIRFVVLSRNGSYIFNIAEGVFNQEPSMNINENFVRFVIQNIKLFINLNGSNSALTKVRTAMSDFIDYEAI